MHHSGRRHGRLALAAAAVAWFVAAPAVAAVFRPFDRAAFDTAQGQGRASLVDVRAWWCPVCASQAHTLKALAAQPQTRDLTIWELNFDTQKPDWKRFGVQKQATLIGFRGAREVGRIAFDTDKARIGALVAATVR